MSHITAAPSGSFQTGVRIEGGQSAEGGATVITEILKGGDVRCG